jgi:hypothetical protein
MSASRQCRRRIPWAAALLSVLVASRGLAAPPPWQRTEVREPCTDSNPLRNPYFGDLHIHTRFSADAYIFGTRVDPRGAYDFARGGTVIIPDENETQTRTARIDRPLDFAAVTDHAEFFGEAQICDTEGSPAYEHELCRIFRQPEPDPRAQFRTTVAWLFPAGVPNPPTSHVFCTLPGVDCDAAAVSVWQEIQAAAEAAYDRTAACSFTSFIGYEHTPSPLGRHLHRNVIFRNDHVPPVAASHLETFPGGTPQGLWSAVETQCLGAGTGCDAVLIPHNSNLSGGGQWLDPADAAEALRRQTLEPLVEIHQIKGNSECRFDRLAGVGVGTADELCTFEQDPQAHQGPDEGPPPIDRYPRRNMVRNTLRDGLALEQHLGVNPFRLGFVGGTDTHNGTAGSVDEAGWEGGQGNNDATPAIQISRQLRTNPGGLTVVWAEENSRDAIFDALRRRETYATSGTRPVVRFFGGDLAGLACGTRDFVRAAYATGTPMGGELGALRGGRSPRFAVWAAKDPGTAERPGTGLQRIQIVKGWVDRNGRTHERVFHVAGNRRRGRRPRHCTPRGAGFRELCAIWRDPTFNRRQRAFYYARVLENPTCRWSTLVCRGAGVDPLSPRCAEQAAAAGAAFADCCLGTANDAFMEPVVQERAWTSPIWYRPEAIARLRARVRFGPGKASDELTLQLGMGHLPARLKLARTALTVRVTDDDEIWTVTIPAGTLRELAPGRFVLTSRGKRRTGLQKGSLAVGGNHEGRLTLRAGPLDLSRADHADHPVTVTLAIGTYQPSHTRLWVARNGTLGSGRR